MARIVPVRLGTNKQPLVKLKASPSGPQGQAGGVQGPASSVADNIATFLDISGDNLKDSGKSFDADGTLTANSDDKIATQKATKTYVQSIITNKPWKIQVKICSKRIIGTVVCHIVVEWKICDIIKIEWICYWII